MIDDATMPGLFGSSPFDDEGVASRRTVVIERGVLKSYLLNTYSARKLGLKTTGNASRGLTGNAGVGPGNFYIEAGEAYPQEMIAGLRSGLICDRADRRAAPIPYRRLFHRRGGHVDRERRIGVSCFRDHHRGKFETDADGPGSRSGRDLEFRGSIAAPSHADWGDDHQWPLNSPRARPQTAILPIYIVGAVLVLGVGDVRVPAISRSRAAPDLPLTPEAKAYVRNLNSERRRHEGQRKLLSSRWWWRFEGKIGNAGDRDCDCGRDLLRVLRHLRPAGAASSDCRS